MSDKPGNHVAKIGSRCHTIARSDFQDAQQALEVCDPAEGDSPHTGITEYTAIETKEENKKRNNQQGK